MADLPITMSGPMVRALLREIEAPGTGKTQTRRTLKPHPVPCLMWGDPPAGTYPSENGWSRLRYAPGDRLYVREHWRGHVEYDDLSPSEMGGEEPILYLADGWGKADPTKWGRHRQAMHMPRWASRITLIVTEVRVQRLQSISEADALAEGVERLAGSKGPNHFTREIHGKWSGSFNAPTAQEVYADLWNSLHGPGAWAENPWVCAVTFRPVPGNIDQIGGGG